MYIQIETKKFTQFQIFLSTIKVDGFHRVVNNVMIQGYGM